MTDDWDGKFSFARVERPVTIPAWMDREAVIQALTKARAESEKRWKEARDDD